jgi:polysaccharide biosynthesis protein PslH
MKILVITNTIPYPTTSGGALRNYNLLKRIAAHHQVWLATSLESPEELEGVPHLKEFCHEVITGLIQRKPKISHLPGLLRYFIKGWPLELKFRECPEVGKKIHEVCLREDFDIIQIEESRMALYLEYLPKGQKSKKILTFYDIGFAQSARFISLEKDPWLRWRSRIYSFQMEHWEPKYTQKFDLALTVSQADKDLLLGKNTRLRVEIIPNGVDTHTYQPLPVYSLKPNLLFIGNMSYLPCVDAAIFLVQKILPRLLENIPDIEIWIVGADPVPEVLDLAGEKVHITGRVPDISPYYERSTLAVVPIRAGGGTRLKILEAMALGRPVVSTTIGCEGLDVVNGKHLLIADQPDDFANQIIRLIQDKDLYGRIVANAKALVSEQYDWDKISGKLMGLYEELVDETTKAK